MVVVVVVAVFVCLFCRWVFQDDVVDLNLTRCWEFTYICFFFGSEIIPQPSAIQYVGISW